ncbi:protein translocase subunit SecF, partial [Candidatus Babeliales bacterium]|nr:protein translocase subunit SecF [Candidatus Babeliales bacterium]
MIDFLKYRYMCMFGSLVLLGCGVAGYVFNRGFQYHIDFSGGSEIRVAFEEAINIAKLRSCVNSGGWAGAVIQSVVGTGGEFIIKLGDKDVDIKGRFSKVVEEAFPKVSFKICSVEQVGAEAGKEVRWNAVLSIVLALVGLLVYIAIRHRYAYAVGAVVALAHDLLVLLAFYLVFAWPISLNILAGILTVLGYSLNDTIVVFSRIRENAHLHKSAPHEEVVNMSLNQTLRRTLLTSFTTLIAVL